MVRILALFFFIPALVFAADSFKPFSNELRPFVSDGCSAFPDSFMSYSWEHCCVEHDYASWKGGTKKDKVLADQRLKQCVGASASEILGSIMELGVVVGGLAELPTSWHWGYGWALNRDYKKLGTYEQEQIAKVTPRLPDYVEIEVVDVIPERPNVTGDYCLDLALAQILDDQKRSQVEYKVLTDKLSGSSEGDIRSLEILTKTCEKPYRVNFLLLTRGACTVKTNELLVRGRVRLELINSCFK